jgi:hypothetical protein
LTTGDLLFYTTPYIPIINVQEDKMLDPVVHASIISVAGDWAKFIFEVTKCRTEDKDEALAVLRRDFETAYKELLRGVQIYQPREEK